MSALESTCPRRVGGRPLATVTDAQRAEVETLSAVLTAEQIADFLGIGRTTFFAMLNRDEDLSERYKRGKARAVGAVAQSLVTKARAGNVTAMIFFLKTQGGWRETVQVAETTPQPGDMLDLSGFSDADLTAILEIFERAGAAPTLEREGDNGFPDRARDQRDLRFGMRPGIARVGHKVADRAVVDADLGHARMAP